MQNSVVLSDNYQNQGSWLVDLGKIHNETFRDISVVLFLLRDALECNKLSDKVYVQTVFGASANPDEDKQTWKLSTEWSYCLNEKAVGTEILLSKYKTVCASLLA